MSEFQLARLNAILNNDQQNYMRRLIRESIDVSYVSYDVLQTRVLSKLKANAKDVAQADRAAIALKKSLRYLLFAMEEDKEITKFMYPDAPYVQFGAITPNF